MRVALLCDSPDERWPSMDVVGEMLLRELPPPVQPEQILRPIRSVTPNFTVNRILFRFIDYPHWVKRNRSRFDVFHVVDHSYSQLVHSLPPERTVVTCHDIDTFRSVLEPQSHPRNPMFRAMTRRILTGFRKAAHVACDSGATMADLLQHKVLPKSRLSVVPLGTHPTCSPHPNPIADVKAAELLGTEGDTVDLLHVGSNIARKRIDLLLRLFAAARKQQPTLRLLRIGGAFTASQELLARELKIRDSILVLPFLDRETLAAVYRRAKLLLLPSDAEGFGLPVAEAMACGTPVLSSDLPVLREVGGNAAEYATKGDISAWAEKVLRLAHEYESDDKAWRNRIQEGIEQSALFSWANYARRMANVYNGLL